MALAQGERRLTGTGRPTTPFPRVDCTTRRKALNSIRRAHDWLRSNAIGEAAARGDRFNQRVFEADTRPTPSSLDGMEEYLFGPVMPVRRSILRPLSNPTKGEWRG